MIDTNILLNNPLVPQGYYYAKVISIEAETSNYRFPKFLIKLKIHPIYCLEKGSLFCAILNPNERSYIHYVNFFNTFFLGEEIENHEKAVGEWGSVELKPAEFGGIEYSSVRFCYQPLPVRMESWRIGRDERESRE